MGPSEGGHLLDVGSPQSRSTALGIKQGWNGVGRGERLSGAAKRQAEALQSL